MTYEEKKVAVRDTLIRWCSYHGLIIYCNSHPITRDEHYLIRDEFGFSYHATIASVRIDEDYLSVIASIIERAVIKKREHEDQKIAKAKKMMINATYGFTNMFKPGATIKNVIFNDPATIVFWTDGTKTVVKCQEGEIYDREKGLAMAISKKTLGFNKRDYYNIFTKWLAKDDKRRKKVDDKMITDMCKAFDQLGKVIRGEKK